MPLATAGVAVVRVGERPSPAYWACSLTGLGVVVWFALGVGGELRGQAGPVVRRVGVFAGTSMVTAPMPATGNGVEGGRAVSRESRGSNGG